MGARVDVDRRCVGALLAALALAGCGGGGGTGDADAPRAKQPRPKPPHAKRPHARPTPPAKPVRCPADAPPGCRAATGRIVYVEAVDPDGDGDAHFVLTSHESITGPGLTVIDVERELRPHPLPRVGDAVAAAGPVYRGSYGQRQIQAIELRVARARRGAP